MNCKPGDLAICFRAPNVPEAIDMVVTIDRMSPSKDCWYSIEQHYSKNGNLIVWNDKDMRPITPPPGSVTEDEVKELYSPVKEVA